MYVIVVLQNHTLPSFSRNISDFAKWRIKNFSQKPINSSRKESPPSFKAKAHWKAV